MPVTLITGWSRLTGSLTRQGSVGTAYLRHRVDFVDIKALNQTIKEDLTRDSGVVGNLKLLSGGTSQVLGAY